MKRGWNSFFPGEIGKAIHQKAEIEDGGAAKMNEHGKCTGMAKAKKPTTALFVQVNARNACIRPSS
ncbi:MAG: hypothetical protein LBE32_07295 [Burkholderiales bacterium]|nr:hypothetical protein [Burkholderiales bacterium]